MTPNTSRLSIMQHNINSLQRNHEELLLHLQQNSPDVICLNETRLHPDDNVDIPGYSIACRIDSPTHRQHGSLIAVKEGMIHETTLNKAKADIRNRRTEILEIRLHKCNTYITNMYCSPTSWFTKEEFEEIMKPNERRLLVGDLNAHTRLTGTKRPNNTGRQLEKFLEKSDCYVINDNTPTRGEHILDLHIASRALAQTNIAFAVGDCLGSDHHTTTSTFTSTQDYQQKKGYQLSKADWRKYSETMKNKIHTCTTLWPPRVPSTIAELQTATDSTIEIFNATKELEIPKQPTRRQLSNAVVNMIKYKRRLRKQKSDMLKSAADPEAIRIIKTSINRLTTKIKTQRLTEEHERLEAAWTKVIDSQSSFNDFWPAIKRTEGKSKTRSIKPISHDGITATTSMQKSTLMGNYLAQQMTEPPDIIKDATFNNQVKESLTTIRSTEEDSPPITVLEINTALKASKLTSPGEDGITNKELKHIPMAMKITLACLFTASIRLGHLPPCWKSAKVKFIPKAGKDQSTPRGHRPISLINCIAKLLENVMKNRLLKFAEDNNLIGDDQSAYRKHRSTSDNLLRLSQTVSEALQQRQTVAAAFLDVQSAFDKVWHDGLIHKLHKMGIPTYMTRWIDNFLRGRAIHVNYDCFKSHEFTMLAGVPQGSVIAPILYILYVAQTPETKAATSKFADDISLWARSRSPALAAKHLQESLNKISAFCQKWRINLTATASKPHHLIYFTRKKSEMAKIYLDGEEIVRTNKATVLGLTIDAKLGFSHHINNIYAKGWTRTNKLRTLAARGMDESTLVKIYKACVRPAMTYAPIAWINTSASQKMKLERMQYIATKIITGATQNPAAVTLRQHCNLETVEDHCTRLAKRYTDKIMQGSNTLMLNVYNNAQFIEGRTPKPPIQIINEM